MQMIRVGFAGLGAMGNEMARKVCENGRSDIGTMFLYNRTASKAHALQQALMQARTNGADAGPRVEVVADIQAFASESCGMDVACFMLMGDASTDDTIGRFIIECSKVNTSKPLTLMNCATVSAATVTKLQAMAAKQQRPMRFVNCSVTGRPEHVANKQLCSWLASADAEALALAESVAQKWSKKTAVVSRTDPAASARFKIATNFMVYGMAELLGEELLLLDRAGIDRKYLLEWTDGLCKGTIVDLYARKMVDREFGQGGNVGASAEVGKKDLGLIEELYAGASCSGGGPDEGPAAKRQKLDAGAQARLPIAAAARAHMERQCAELRERGIKESDREWCSFLEAMERSPC